MEFATIIDENAAQICRRWESKFQKGKPFPTYSDIKAIVDTLTKKDIKTVEGSFENDDDDWWEEEAVDERIDVLFEQGFEPSIIHIHRPVSEKLETVSM